MDFTPTEEEKSLLSLLLSGQESNIELAKSLFEYSVAPDLGMESEQDFLYKFGYGGIYSTFYSFSKQVLELFDTEITHIPVLSNFTKKIIFAGKQWKNLPSIYANSVVEIDCKYNKISKLSNKLPNNLQRLDCAYNSLTSLPDNLPNSMVELDCSYNYIMVLPENLPENLKHLNCEHNSLKILPEKLPKNLTSFAYNGNKISKLPINPPSGLKTIYINSSTPDKYIEEYENKYPNIEIKLR